MSKWCPPHRCAPQQFTLHQTGATPVVLVPTSARGHQDGCHAQHSCPSDANPPTYTCGDTGHCSQCSDNQFCLAGQPRLAAPQCGVERWPVKTGTDADAGLVNLGSVTPTSIAALRAWSKPASLPENNRIAPVETTVWTVDGLLTVYKLEDDSDYHLVLQDPSGNTMITEIPSPSCVGAGSPFAQSIAFARSKFDSMLTATGSFQAANVPVRVTGVGFFDFLHGQTGVAPNGIELHPVLDVVFNPSPNRLSLNLALNTHTVRVGDMVQVSGTAINSGSAVVVDLYFVIVLPPPAGPGLGCPNGDALAFFAGSLSNPVISCASAPSQTFPALLQNVTVGAGTQTTAPNFFSVTWPSAPAGTYTFAIVATPPGAFADGSVDPGDLLAVGSDTMRFSP